jgi:hypothetical protein
MVVTRPRVCLDFLTACARVKTLPDSVRTKSGVFKDERDTVKRRHRHRDGKLLRGGIGLTTGLGWSDRYVSICSIMSQSLLMS